MRRNQNSILDSMVKFAPEPDLVLKYETVRIPHSSLITLNGTFKTNLLLMQYERPLERRNQGKIV